MYLQFVTHLKNTDKKKGDESRESHMNHGKSYGKWKVEVIRRQNPLPKTKQKKPCQTAFKAIS